MATQKDIDTAFQMIVMSASDIDMALPKPPKADNEKLTIEEQRKMLAVFARYISEGHPGFASVNAQNITFPEEVKNKFRELRQYDLGYKISTPIPNKSKSSESKSGTGSPKSAHYRSAHWHHFWTGSGDDKKLIIKWVDGVFVNGKAEQDVAVVHTLK